MQKMRLITLAASFIIFFSGGTLIHPVSSANAETSAPAGKTDGTATHVSALSGGSGMTAKPQATSKVKPGTYVVRTVWKSAPLSNVRVEWRHQPEEAAPAMTGVTVRLGTAVFQPKSGSYYLTAEWRKDGNFKRPQSPGDRFAWLGGNPLLVSSESSEMITLMLAEIPAPVLSTPPAGTGIFGLVTLEGIPIANAGVYAYSNSDSGFKGDDFQATTRTNAKGEFAFELPPGSYYILTRLRKDNSVDLGPLHKEDLLGYDPWNPVVVEQGHFTASVIPSLRLKMVKSRTESSAFLPGTIEGRIVNSKGQPVPGVYAAIYNKASMSGRSVFRSEPVGTDGRFKLSVPIPGSYFLGARSGYGSPVPGVWTGTWDGSADHSIVIKTGETHPGVEIIVEQISEAVKSPKKHEAVKRD